MSQKSLPKPVERPLSEGAWADPHHWRGCHNQLRENYLRLPSTHKHNRGNSKGKDLCPTL